ncbi:hypothetical protein [Pseudomonas sp. 2FE]|nr:hypothetical protein [Pseudomonas sp. 2FE]
MTKEIFMQKQPVWDLVGLALTLDKRLILVVPVLVTVAYFASKLTV